MKPTHLESSEALSFQKVILLNESLILIFLPFGTSNADIPNLEGLKLGIQLWHLRNKQKNESDTQVQAKDSRAACKWPCLWKTKKISYGREAIPPHLFLLLNKAEGKC